MLHTYSNAIFFLSKVSIFPYLSFKMRAALSLRSMVNILSHKGQEQIEHSRMKQKGWLVCFLFRSKKSGELKMPLEGRS